MLAATPKSVKAAYDLANGKYTAQDATTAQKGIVQLSSATNSASETFAATPKAVKAANDNANGRVPGERKVNGKPLTNDVNVTSQDIFNSQSIEIGANQNLDNYKTPGLYHQPLNANASASLKYPENLAGTLVVLKNAGITQIYYVYNTSRSYTHSVSGTAASAGAHTHSMTFVSGGSSGAPGSGSPDYSKYSVNTSSAGAHTHSVSGTAASAGAHAHTVGIGAHTHSVAIGSHGHTITVNAAGNAENTVKNIAFNYIVRLA